MAAGLYRWQETLDAQSRHKWQEVLTQEDVETPIGQEFTFLIPYGTVDIPNPPTVDALSPAIAPRTLSGTAAPGATIQIVIDGVPFVTVPAPLLADQNGNWAYGYNGSVGLHSIEVRQLVDGVASEYTAPKVFSILADTQPVEDDGLGHGFHEDEEKKKPPPEVGRVRIPFRRPRAWATEKAG